MSKYDHLNITVSDEFHYKIKNKLPLHSLPKFYFIIRTLHKFKIIRRIASAINLLDNYRRNNVKNTEEIINKTIEKELKKKNLLGNEFESDWGYDEFHEIQVIFQYYEQIIKDFKPPHLTESKLLYDNIIEICSEFIEKNQIKNFINFGSLLSHTDSILAKKFNNTIFYCADRSKYTKKLNEFIYEGIENMKFIDGDIFDFLNTKYENSVFFSTRTALIMPKFFLDKLYETVYKADYKYVMLFEQIGISHETNQSYKFSDEDKESVAYRWGMHIHNYPGILKKAGYDVIDSKLIKTDHPFEDYRFLYVLGKKNENKQS